LPDLFRGTGRIQKTQEQYFYAKRSGIPFRENQKALFDAKKKKKGIASLHYNNTPGIPDHSSGCILLDQIPAYQPIEVSTNEMN
jgi:hypothetical protein